MKTETQQASAQMINSNFVRKLESGQTKEAAEQGTAFIRTLVREEAYSREVLVPRLLQDDEIDRDVNTDEPRKIVEKEPDSVATYVQFRGNAPREYFKGKRYAVYFGKTESQHFTKSKFELMTYLNDIRKILADNSVKDLADQEDTKFQGLITDIVAANAAEQRTLAGAFNSAAFTQAGKKLIGRRRPVGKMTMCKGLFMEAMDLPATAVGNDVASRHYKEGVENEESLWGIPVITTIKSHVHPERKAYLYAPENFLGNFFLLQDATLFIKQEADMITFWTYAAPGIGIANTLSVQEIEFT